ncbi:hypothetical protein RJ55_03920 [Drechmeria coniospora]|nr:hypothetical protein RJ55_03920 [Drechmeria coniospora]
MNYLTAYTPLESLFLFQSLLAQGVDTGAFVHISDVLKNNALVQGGETYDPARLSPEALQRLFLLLLRDEVKEEVKDEEERPEGTSGGGRGSLDGVGSPGSRKRKLTSPPLPSLQDAYERIENVPVLVNRLYVRYREYMVKLIQEDERKFANVQRDIQLLEKSEKERLAKAAPSTTAAGGLKWEKPYQPPQADQTLPVGQHQQIVQPSAAGHPKLPQNVSQNMPQNMPQNAPQNAPQKQPQNAPQKPPQKPLQKLPPGQSQPQQRQQQQQQSHRGAPDTWNDHTHWHDEGIWHKMGVSVDAVNARSRRDRA